jgi:hypothetical protein
MHVGIFESNMEEIRVREQDDRKLADQPYVVEGGELTYDITELGITLYDALN